MRIIDTHAHLYADEFKEDLPKVIFRAKQAGVAKVLLPNIDAESVEPLKNTFNKYPDFFIPMMGLHPTSVSENWQPQLETIKEELNSYEYKAIGEIGLDFYWDLTYKEQQIKVFETQLRWSKEKKIPVSMHSRNAIPAVVASIKKIGSDSLSGVFHSFGGSSDELNEILSLETFYVGINGVVTFKNSALAEVLKNCPVEKIVVETDAPYLAPVPYRGKRNEVVYLKEILAKLAEIFSIKVEDLAKITTENTLRLFNI